MSAVPPGTDRIADIIVRLLRAKSCREQPLQIAGLFDDLVGAAKQR
jgi:hypothetical protein